MKKPIFLLILLLSVLLINDQAEAQLVSFTKDPAEAKEVMLLVF